MVNRNWLAASAGACAISIALAGCSHNEPESKSTQRPNVLIIAVDTLRADRLGCYGNKLGLTPRLDRLADHSVRFDNAYAHAPWTLPSFASLYTSQPPAAHGAGGRVGQFRRLAPQQHTLAECFRDANYTTACIVNVDFLTSKFGMTQGFDHVDFKVYPNNIQLRNATETTDAALHWLSDDRDQPFFLLVHYFDPHLVYAPPRAYRASFADPRDHGQLDWVLGTRRQIVAFRRGQLRIPDHAIRRAEKLYNGEVAYTDHEIGRLLDGLAERRLRASTIIVLVSDHGEEFLDHGGFEHGHTLYNELLHVPLLVSFPQKLAAQVVDHAVSLKDVAPTICTLADVAPPPTFQGENLLANASDSHDASEEPLLLEGNFWGQPHVGLVHRDYKLINAPGNTQLYNLRHDPTEMHNLSSAQPERLARLLRTLRTERTAARAAQQSPHEQVRPDAAELERLRSLGYVR